MSKPSEQFQRRVEELVARFEQDLDPEEWVARRYPKRLRDEAGEVYEVPALYVQKGPSRLLLDPIGYDVPGAEGVADLYLMPTYDSTASLLFEGGKWMFHYDSTAGSDPASTCSMNEIQVLPLSAETINQVLDAIAENAIPSV
jgi:hypothetical protein